MFTIKEKTATAEYLSAKLEDNGSFSVQDVLEYRGKGGTGMVGSTLNDTIIEKTSYYTPEFISETICKSLRNQGLVSKDRLFTLDPSVGKGNFLAGIKYLGENNFVVGLDIDPIAIKLAPLYMAEKGFSPNLFDVNENIVNKRNGFFVEKMDFFTMPDEVRFDLVMSNVPFGDIKIFYDNKNESIHNAFALKMIEQTKEDGFCVIMTSAFFMDAETKDTRSKILDKADFCGAVRFPLGTFPDADICADVCIFRKKTDKEQVLGSLFFDKALMEKQQELNSFFLENVIVENGDNRFSKSKYFEVNAENELGREVFKQGYLGLPFRFIENDNMEKLPLQFENALNAVLSYLPSFDNRIFNEELLSIDDSQKNLLFRKRLEQIDKGFIDNVIISDWVMGDGIRSVEKEILNKCLSFVYTLKYSVPDKIMTYLSENENEIPNQFLWKFLYFLNNHIVSPVQMFGETNFTNIAYWYSMNFMKSYENKKIYIGNIFFKDYHIFLNDLQINRKLSSNHLLNLFNDFSKLENDNFFSLLELGKLKYDILFDLKKLEQEYKLYFDTQDDLTKFNNKKNEFFERVDKVLNNGNNFLPANFDYIDSEAKKKLKENNLFLKEALPSTFYIKNNYIKKDDSLSYYMPIIEKVNEEHLSLLDKSLNNRDIVMYFGETLKNIISKSIIKNSSSLRVDITENIENIENAFIFSMTKGIFNMDLLMDVLEKSNLLINDGDEQVQGKYFKDDVIKYLLKENLVFYCFDRNTYLDKETFFKNRNVYDLKMDCSKRKENSKYVEYVELANKKYYVLNFDDINYQYDLITNLIDKHLKQVSFENIDISISDTWLPKNLYSKFLKENFSIINTDIYVKESVFNKNTIIDLTQIEMSGKLSNEVLDWNIGDRDTRESIKKILNVAINNVEPKITRDGKKDESASELLKEKVDKIKELFLKFIKHEVLQDDSIRVSIEEAYNYKKNNLIDIRNIGSDINFNQEGVQLYPLQEVVSAKMVNNTGGVAYIDVGGGKTKMMNVSSHKLLELGKIMRALTVGINANYQDLALDYNKMFPNDKIIIVQSNIDSLIDENLQDKNLEFVFSNDKESDSLEDNSIEDIKNIDSNQFNSNVIFVTLKNLKNHLGNRDIKNIFMSYHQLARIPMGLIDEKTGEVFSDRGYGYLNESKYNEALEKKQGKNTLSSIKKAQESLSDIINDIKLKNLNYHKKIEVPLYANLGYYFKDLNVDFVCFDECHVAKNLVVPCNSVVKGVNQSNSRNAFIVLNVCREIQKIHKVKNSFSTMEKGIIMASGTVVLNNVASESYNVLFMQSPSLLKVNGVYNFDDYLNFFTNISSDYDVSTTGGVKQIQRIREIKNLDMLRLMWDKVGMFADREDLKIMNNLKIPKQTDINITVKQDFLQEFLTNIGRSIALCGASYKQDRKETKKDLLFSLYKDVLGKNVENIKPEGLAFASALVSISVSKQANINPFMISRWMFDELTNCTNYVSPKVKAMAKEIAKIYYSEDSQKNKGTQLVFSDFGVGSSDNKDFKNLKKDKDKVSILRQIGYELMRMGIPKRELFFMENIVNKSVIKLSKKNQGEEKMTRKQLNERLNSGNIRICFGGTSTLGTGLNVQERVMAIHNADIVWRPADFIQRIGRGVRQGNMFDEVKVFNYLSENSLDSFTLGLLHNKKNLIEDFKKANRQLLGNTSKENNDDNLNLDFARMLALVTGDNTMEIYYKQDKEVKKTTSQINGERIFVNRQEREIELTIQNIKTQKKLHDSYLKVCNYYKENNINVFEDSEKEIREKRYNFVCDKDFDFLNDSGKCIEVKKGDIINIGDASLIGAYIVNELNENSIKNKKNYEIKNILGSTASVLCEVKVSFISGEYSYSVSLKNKISQQTGNPLIWAGKDIFCITGNKNCNKKYSAIGMDVRNFILTNPHIKLENCEKKLDELEYMKVQLETVVMEKKNKIEYLSEKLKEDMEELKVLKNDVDIFMKSQDKYLQTDVPLLQQQLGDILTCIKQGDFMDMSYENFVASKANSNIKVVEEFSFINTVNTPVQEQVNTPVQEQVNTPVQEQVNKEEFSFINIVNTPVQELVSQGILFDEEMEMGEKIVLHPVHNKKITQVVKDIKKQDKIKNSELLF